MSARGVCLYCGMSAEIHLVDQRRRTGICRACARQALAALEAARAELACVSCGRPVGQGSDLVEDLCLPCQAAMLAQAREASWDVEAVR